MLSLSFPSALIAVPTQDMSDFVLICAITELYRENSEVIFDQPYFCCPSVKTPHKKCFSRDIYSRFAKYAAVKPTIVESKAAFESNVSVAIQFCCFLHIVHVV